LFSVVADGAGGDVERDVWEVAEGKSSREMRRAARSVPGVRTSRVVFRNDLTNVDRMRLLTLSHFSQGCDQGFILSSSWETHIKVCVHAKSRSLGGR
jgi:hypothetical protein